MTQQPPAVPAQSVAAFLADKSLTGILTNEYPNWKDDFIRNSFYLPVQVLKDVKYKVEPIKLISGSEFVVAVVMPYRIATGWKLVYEGCNLTMLLSCVTVGVSMRQVVATGEKIVVVKVWYGKSGRMDGRAEGSN